MDLKNGKICYVEIPADDIAVSSEFYREVFGWETRTRSDGSLAFDDGVGQVSGTWTKGRSPSTEPGLLIYIMVDDIDDACEKVAASGGSIVQPVDREMRETIARFSDPAGNVLGLYQEPSLK